MSILDEAQRLVAAGRQKEAIQKVLGAADQGDCEAMFAVANWRLFALYGPRDLDEAHRLLERAGDEGYVEAVRLRAILIGNGTGCSSCPEKAAALLSEIRKSDSSADLQLTLAKRMRSATSYGKVAVEQLCEAPSIRSVRKLLEQDECQYIMAMAAPHLQPSFVIDPRTGQRIPHPVRTSSGMSFGPTQEDLVIHDINRRIAAVTGTQADWGEPLHILNYAPGQQYRPHIDALPATANQRYWTVLIYLNDGYGGGQTRFDTLGIEFSGRQGDALIFRNVDESGMPDPRTRHAGLPVTNGTKWLATRWIRQARYHPWDERTS
jgi:prolyl 4-hydroxylase